MPLTWIFSVLQEAGYGVEWGQHKPKTGDERFHVQCRKYCFEIHHSPGWGTSKGEYSGYSLTDTLLQKNQNLQPLDDMELDSTVIWGKKGWTLEGDKLTEVANILKYAFLARHQAALPTKDVEVPRLSEFVRAQGQAVASTWPEASQKLLLLEEFVIALPQEIQAAVMMLDM